MASTTTAPIQLDEIAASIRSLVSADKGDEAQEASLALESFHPNTLSDLRLAVAVFVEIKRVGWAEVMFDRYLNAFPADMHAEIDRVELHAKLGGKTVQEQLAALKANAADEHIRIATIWRRLGKNNYAAIAFQQAVDKQPSNLDARRGLIETLNWSLQHKPARKAIDDLHGMMPDEALWWALLAEQAITAKYTKLFRTAAPRAESMLGVKDNVPRLLLARAHSLNADPVSVDRVIGGWRIAELTEAWLLGAILKVAEDNNLPDRQKAIAQHVVELKKLDPALTEKCRQIVLSYEAFGRKG